MWCIQSVRWPSLVVCFIRYNLVLIYWLIHSSLFPFCIFNLSSSLPFIFLCSLKCWYLCAQKRCVSYSSIGSHRKKVQIPGVPPPQVEPHGGDSLNPPAAVEATHAKCYNQGSSLEPWCPGLFLGGHVVRMWLISATLTLAPPCPHSQWKCVFMLNHTVRKTFLG